MQNSIEKTSEISIAQNIRILLDSHSKYLCNDAFIELKQHSTYEEEYETNNHDENDKKKLIIKEF